MLDSEDEVHNQAFFRSYHPCIGFLLSNLRLDRTKEIHTKDMYEN
jgi:hypothetical protein